MMLKSRSMSIEAAAGFWSYAHEDNKLDDGAILKLAHLVAEEYSLLSGDPLELFVDRNSIAWGEEWRNRIDSALAQTTFFIPIITPRYFARPECRRELLEFTAKAKGLGVQELLLPILYVEPQGFSVESPDEAVVLVAKTQYADWRTVRLAEFSSREYRSAVNVLVRRLLEIARIVSENQLNRELNEGSEEEDIDGITDILENVTALLQPWLDAVIGGQVNYAQVVATYEQGLTQITRVQSRKAPASAVLAARMRLIKELLPLFEREQREARVYLARSVELDPLMSTLARLIAEHPDYYELIDPVREAVDEAMVEIRAEDEKKTRPAGIKMGDRLREWSKLGRAFQKCHAIAQDVGRNIQEGNDVVRRWDRELRKPSELPPTEAGPKSRSSLEPASTSLILAPLLVCLA
jgi:hypothetical protein